MKSLVCAVKKCTTLDISSNGISATVIAGNLKRIQELDISGNILDGVNLRNILANCAGLSKLTLEHGANPGKKLLQFVNVADVIKKNSSSLLALNISRSIQAVTSNLKHCMSLMLATPIWPQAVAVLLLSLPVYLAYPSSLHSLSGLLRLKKKGLRYLQMVLSNVQAFVSFSLTITTSVMLVLQLLPLLLRNVTSSRYLMFPVTTLDIYASGHLLKPWKEVETSVNSTSLTMISSLMGRDSCVKLC